MFQDEPKRYVEGGNGMEVEEVSEGEDGRRESEREAEHPTGLQHQNRLL